MLAGPTEKIYNLHYTTIYINIQRDLQMWDSFFYVV